MTTATAERHPPTIRVKKKKSTKRVKRKRRRNTNVAAEVAAEVAAKTETAKERETSIEVTAVAEIERGTEKETDTEAEAGTETAREGNIAVAIAKTSRRMTTSNACLGQCRRQSSSDRVTIIGIQVTIKLRCDVTCRPLHRQKSGFGKNLEINLRHVAVRKIVTINHVTPLKDVTLRRATKKRATELQRDRKMRMISSGIRNGRQAKFRKRPMIK